MSNVDNKPWDKKEIKISLGGESDSNGWLICEIFSDSEFLISFTGADFRFEDGQVTDKTDFTVEEMDLDVARRLRDFLIYAIPEAI